MDSDTGLSKIFWIPWGFDKTLLSDRRPHALEARAVVKSLKNAEKFIIVCHVEAYNAVLDIIYTWLSPSRQVTRSCRYYFLL